MQANNCLSFDTSIYIDHFRGYSNLSTIRLYFSKGIEFVVDEVVLYELYAGSRSKRETNLIEELKKMFRVITVRKGSFCSAGKILNQMVADHLVTPENIHRLENDLLIALNCVENSAILVSKDKKDLKKILRYLPHLQYRLFW